MLEKYKAFDLVSIYFSKTREKTTGIESGITFSLVHFLFKPIWIGQRLGRFAGNQIFCLSKQSLYCRSNLSFKSSEEKVIYG